MTDCLHTEFKVVAGVHRITAEDTPQGRILPAQQYTVDIRVWCTDCDQAFEWIGPPIGVSPQRPTCSVDGTELRAPIRPTDWARHAFDRLSSHAHTWDTDQGDDLD